MSLRNLMFFLLFVSFSQTTFSQGIELYGGYPMRIPAKSSEHKVKNWNNGQAGFNANIYIRAVFIQLGIGYTSNNYTLKYAVSSPLNERTSSIVFHQYVFIPIMVYPKLYADGKNVLSLGAGTNIMFPINKYKTTLTYEDGTSINIIPTGNFNLMIMPRVAIRYSRWLQKSFYLFSDIYTDFTVMEAIDNNPHYTLPHYESKARIGINIGIGYFLPIDYGLKKPRYFEKWKTKVKE